MPKNKVNNNIKLKSGGGIINDATDGLSVDTTIIATKTYADSKIEITDIASDAEKYDCTPIGAITGATYTKYREIELNEDLPAVRIKMGFASNSGTIFGQIYKNGVAIGTEQSTVNATAVKTEDFTDLVSGDLIQVYAKCTAGTGNINDVKFYFTRTATKLNGSTVITPIPLTFGTQPTKIL